MNIRKHYPNYPISEVIQADINRIIALWEYCQSNALTNGPWLFGEFSAADAMFAPVVMRFIGYDVKLSDFAADYVDFVSINQHMQDWIVAAKKETQVIVQDEV
jgi:glutathione S-transferase